MRRSRILSRTYEILEWCVSIDDRFSVQSETGARRVIVTVILIFPDVYSMLKAVGILNISVGLYSCC